VSAAEGIGPVEDPHHRDVQGPDWEDRTTRGGVQAGERAAAERGGIEVALVSGLSGAGRSTAAKVLEDLGWFVVDNLPPELIATMVDLGSRARGEITRIAVVMDVRSRAFSTDLGAVIKDLDTRGYKPRLLFLEASDAVLVRRFEQVRRSHPLQGDGRLVDGIAAERDLLRTLRESADLVVDTSTTAVPALRAKLEQAFGSESVQATRVTLVSFGYKYGLPMDADLVVDVRFLPNPFWIPELREHTGRDEPVRDYVLSQEGAAEFIDRYLELLGLVGAGYRREGKRYLTVAIGCTGGKHRSVAISEEIARRLHPAEGVVVNVAHRDLGRE
jgi:RNase adapter protein RapZ